LLLLLPLPEHEPAARCLDTKLLQLLPLPEHEPAARCLDKNFLLLLPAAWTRTCCPLP